MRGVPLLDVNVLVALAWPNHVHHARAHDWFAGADAWATCPVTQSGFVRVSSNSRAIPDARTPSEAIELLSAMVAIAGHEFWEDATSIVRSRHGSFDRVVSYRQVTDAHILDVARTHEGHVVTFDRGVLDLVEGGEGSAEVRLIP